MALPGRMNSLAGLSSTLTSNGSLWVMEEGEGGWALWDAMWRLARPSSQNVPRPRRRMEKGGWPTRAEGT